MRQPREIRITDADIRKRVAAERDRRGDKTSTKTATDLIRERVTQLEQAKRD